MNIQSIFSFFIIAILISLPLPLIISTVFLVMLFIYAFYYAISNKIKPHFNTSNTLVVLFYFITVFSYTWSIDKELTIIGIGRKVSFLLVPLLFTVIPPITKTARKKLFYWFAISLGFYALFFMTLGIIYYFKTGSLENLSHHKLVSPLGLNRIYMSLFTSVALLFLFFENNKKQLNKLLIVLLTVFLILLSSKTIIISTLLLVLFLFNKNKKALSTKYKYSIPLSMGLIVLVITTSNIVNPRFLSELNPKLTKTLTETDFKKNYYFNGADLRILYTRFLLEYNKENPKLLLTGFGENASQQKINEKCIKYRIPEGYGTTFNFHNQYNQTLAETGIISLFIILFLLYLNLKKSYLSFDYFGFATIFLMAILMATESIFNRQRGIYFFLIIYFIIIKTKKNSFNKIK